MALLHVRDTFTVESTVAKATIHDVVIVPSQELFIMAQNVAVRLEKTVKVRILKGIIYRRLYLYANLDESQLPGRDESLDPIEMVSLPSVDDMFDDEGDVLVLNKDAPRFFSETQKSNKRAYATILVGDADQHTAVLEQWEKDPSFFTAIVLDYRDSLWWPGLVAELLLNRPIRTPTTE